jgi:hypothetical protein
MKINWLHVRIVQPAEAPYWRLAWFDNYNHFMSLFVMGVN